MNAITSNQGEVELMEGDQQLQNKPIRPQVLKWSLGCLAVFIGIPVILCISFFAYYFIDDFVHRNFPEKFTNPMKHEDAEYLCKLLELPMNDTRCETTPTYSFSFFPELRKRYPPGKNIQIVDNEIGRYASCDEWHESFSDGTFKSCNYDFTGDGQYTMYLLFRKENDSASVNAEIWKNSVPIMKNFRFSPRCDCGTISDP